MFPKHVATEHTEKPQQQPREASETNRGQKSKIARRANIHTKGTPTAGPPHAPDTAQRLIKYVRCFKTNGPTPAALASTGRAQQGKDRKKQSERTVRDPPRHPKEHPRTPNESRRWTFGGAPCGPQRIQRASWASPGDPGGPGGHRGHNPAPPPEPRPTPRKILRCRENGPNNRLCLTLRAHHQLIKKEPQRRAKKPHEIPPRHPKGPQKGQNTTNQNGTVATSWCPWPCATKPQGAPQDAD